MAIDRWNPWQEMMSMRESMDRMFQDTFGRTGLANNTFPLDMVENDDNYTLHASLPGFKPEEIQIQVHGDMLTIRAEKMEDKQQPGSGNQRYLMRERRSAQVYRSITLPGPIESDKAQVNYENGVLTLTLPRTQETMTRNIPIGSSSSRQQVEKLIPADPMAPPVVANKSEAVSPESFSTGDGPSTTASTSGR
jgi:HSP20 family protein